MCLALFFPRVPCFYPFPFHILPSSLCLILLHLPNSTTCHYFLVYPALVMSSISFFFLYLALLYPVLPCPFPSMPSVICSLLSVSYLPPIHSLQFLIKHATTVPNPPSSGPSIPFLLYSSLSCQPRSTHALQSNIKLMAVDNP